MTSSQYLSQVEQVLGSEGRGIVMRDSAKPWGIQWNNCPVDPFTEEQPISWYYTSAEALRAADSMYNPYSPSQFPQNTEPVS